MKSIKVIISIIFILLSSFGCNQSNNKCEEEQAWKVKDYRIIKFKCRDLVLAFHNDFDIYLGERRLGNVSQMDSCIFTWQADNERFLKLNVCKNLITELRPNKILLNAKDIDSITIFSNELKKTRTFTTRQIEEFINDWNKSKTRGFSNEPFDSSFYSIQPYQFKLTIYSGDSERPFYGYNYLILDSSNWKYEMSINEDYDYFKEYWKNN